MSEFNVNEFINSLWPLQSTEDIDKAFEPILQFSDDKQKAVGKTLEQVFLSYLEGNFIGGIPLKDLISAEGAAAAKEKYIETKDEAYFYDTRTGQRMPDHVGISSVQAQNKIFSYIDTLLGETASPVAKAYNAAAAGLTDAECNSQAVVQKPRLAALDGLIEQEKAGQSAPKTAEAVTPHDIFLERSQRLNALPAKKKLRVHA